MLDGTRSRCVMSMLLQQDESVIVSAYIQSKIMNVQVGVSREGLSAGNLKKFLIPLPPLAEQKRIVAKIEEILPYCNQLSE